MLGQYKSRIRCLSCSLISNCFDSFLIHQLSLPQFRIYHINQLISEFAFSIDVSYSLVQNRTIFDLKKYLLSKLHSVRNVIIVLTSFQKFGRVLSDNEIILQVDKKKKDMLMISYEISQKDLGRIIFYLEINYPIFTTIYLYQQDVNLQKISLTFVRPFYFDKYQSLLSVHQKIFTHYQ